MIRQRSLTCMASLYESFSGVSIDEYELFARRAPRGVVGVCGALGTTSTPGVPLAPPKFCSWVSFRGAEPIESERAL